MPNRNYRKGYAAELRAKRKLEESGCAVHRSAGSRGVDLVCIHPRVLVDVGDAVLYVSVKSGKRRPTARDRAKLKRAKPTWVSREIWYYAPRCRQPKIIYVV